MWRRIGCIVLIVVFVGIAGLAVWRVTKGGGFKVGAKKTAEKQEPLFEEAKKGELNIMVEATGSTEPVTDIDVKSEATGRIIEFLVKEGDMVKQGDVLCKLDQSNQLLTVQQQKLLTKQRELSLKEAKNSGTKTQRTSLEVALENSRTSLADAEDRLEKARASYDRIAGMHSKGFATDQELDNSSQAMNSALTAVETAKAQVKQAETNLAAFNDESNKMTVEQARLAYESAKVSLAQAQKELGDSIIYSPITGIVLEKPLDVGDSVVSINSAYSGGSTIVKVADLSKIQIRTKVDETDIGTIKVGQAGKVTVDTYPNEDFNGKVTNIYPQGEQTGTGLISFIVIVEVDNTSGKLLGNMTASVKIETQTIKDSLLIPLAATRAGEKPDTTIVYVLKEGEDPLDPKAKTDEREVKLGATDYYNVVVLEGLKEGEKIKVRGFENKIKFGGE
jgi:HlyD family secretion protein